MAYDELAAHLQRETDDLRAQLAAAEEALKAKTEECERHKRELADAALALPGVSGRIVDRIKVIQRSLAETYERQVAAITTLEADNAKLREELIEALEHKEICVTSMDVSRAISRRIAELREGR